MSVSRPFGMAGLSGQKYLRQTRRGQYRQLDRVRTYLYEYRRIELLCSRTFGDCNHVENSPDFHPEKSEIERSGQSLLRMGRTSQPDSFPSYQVGCEAPLIILEFNLARCCRFPKSKGNAISYRQSRLARHLHWLALEACRPRFLTIVDVRLENF